MINGKWKMENTAHYWAFVKTRSKILFIATCFIVTFGLESMFMENVPIVKITPRFYIYNHLGNTRVIYRETL
jgi:hypothetical protein